MAQSQAMHLYKTIEPTDGGYPSILTSFEAASMTFEALAGNAHLITSYGLYIHGPEQEAHIAKISQLVVKDPALAPNAKTRTFARSGEVQSLKDNLLKAIRGKMKFIGAMRAKYKAEDMPVVCLHDFVYNLTKGQTTPCPVASSHPSLATSKGKVVCCHSLHCFEHTKAPPEAVRLPGELLLVQSEYPGKVQPTAATGMNAGVRGPAFAQPGVTSSNQLVKEALKVLRNDGHMHQFSFFTRAGMGSGPKEEEVCEHFRSKTQAAAALMK
jgi:hypothetical protein